MKRRGKKVDFDLISIVGTDFPILSRRSFWIYMHIQEYITKADLNVVKNTDIFEGYTYKKKELFDLLSILKKRNLIKIKRVNKDFSEYALLKKLDLKQAKEVRCYLNKTLKQRKETMKRLAQ